MRLLRWGRDVVEAALSGEGVEPEPTDPEARFEAFGKRMGEESRQLSGPAQVLRDTLAFYGADPSDPAVAEAVRAEAMAAIDEAMAGHREG